MFVGNNNNKSIQLSLFLVFFTRLPGVCLSVSTCLRSLGDSLQTSMNVCVCVFLNVDHVDHDDTIKVIR